MNANLPQLDLPRDYVVGNDITEAILNFYKQTCRLKAGIFVLCVEGNLRASINLTEYTLKPNDFITLMPGSIIQFCEQKESFRLSFIGQLGGNHDDGLACIGKLIDDFVDLILGAGSQ